MEKYVRRQLPWSDGMGVDVRDCETSMEVMQKAELAWQVSKCPLFASMPYTVGSNNEIDNRNGDFAHGGHIFRMNPNAFGTYRTDTNTPLGLVKDKYEIVQNVDAFNFFDQAIGGDKAVWDRAGKFGYGNKIFVTAKLPVTTNVNGDQIDNYLVFSNSHDGSSAVTILITPVRVICNNMLNGALMQNDCYIRLKHTKTVNERLELGARVLKIACQHALDARELYKALADKKMSDEDVMQYMCKLKLTKDEMQRLMSYDPAHGFERVINREARVLEAAEISTRKANLLNSMFDYYNDGVGQKHIYGTAWGAYNAITGYMCNATAYTKEQRMDSLTWGTASRLSSNALSLAYAS